MIAALVAVLIVVAVVWSLAGRGETQNNNAIVATVTREDLTVTLIESGELRAEKRDVITNKVRWEVIIEDLAEQGTAVKEGDVIVRFSCKELEEAILRLELDVESARSQLIQAEADLEQKIQEVKEKLRNADQALENAQADLEKYVSKEGEWGRTRRLQLAGIKTKESVAMLAWEKLSETLAALNADGQNDATTDEQVHQAQQAVQQTSEALQEAKQLWRSIQDEHPRKLAVLEEALQSKQNALNDAQDKIVGELAELGATEEKCHSDIKKTQLEIDELNEAQKKLASAQPAIKKAKKDEPDKVDEKKADNKNTQAGESDELAASPSKEKAPPKELTLAQKKAQAVAKLDQARKTLSETQQKIQSLNKPLHAIEEVIAVAQADLKAYISLEGEWEMKRRERLENITIKEQELEIAEDNLAFKVRAHRRLGEISPYSNSEIKSDQLQLRRRELTLQEARSAWQLLLRYDHPKKVRQLETAVRDKQLARARSKIDAKLVMRKAEDLRRIREDTLRRREKDLNRHREDEQDLTVKAKRAGLVVYDTRRNRWDRNNVVVAKGEKIRQGQQIMIIPDMTTLRFATKVYEAEYAEVKKGLKAYIKLKNKPNEVLSGTVDEIGVLPDPSRWYNRDIKVYTVFIKLDQQIEGLTPSMTGEVELELARLKNVLQIPISAIFAKEDKKYCWRLVDGRHEKVEIEVGKSNDTRVEITSGLEKGDKVLLIEPENLGKPDKKGKSALPGTAG